MSVYYVIMKHYYDPSQADYADDCGSSEASISLHVVKYNAAQARDAARELASKSYTYAQVYRWDRSRDRCTGQWWIGGRYDGNDKPEDIT